MSHVDISHVVYLPTQLPCLHISLPLMYSPTLGRVIGQNVKDLGSKDCQSLGFCAAGNYMNVHEPIADESGKCMRHVGSIRSGKQQ
jgi:hypothetical protein